MNLLRLATISLAAGALAAQQPSLPPSSDQSAPQQTDQPAPPPSEQPAPPASEQTAPPQKTRNDQGTAQRVLGAIGRGFDKAASATAGAVSATASATKKGVTATAGATKSAATRSGSATKTAAGATAGATKTAAGATAGAARTTGGATASAYEKTASATEVTTRTVAGATGGALSTAGETLKSGGMVDINHASEQEIEALPGIGDAYARKIIEARPYRAKNELYTKGILPRETYDRVRNRVVARNPNRAAAQTAPQP